MRTANGARRRAAGFTLIEILTAMSLAVLVMVGVAQIFKMTSDMVTESEKISDGYQMGRGAMTVLQHDWSRMTPEGYLCVVPTEVPWSYQHSSGRIGDYWPYSCRFDTLAFTAVGLFEDLAYDGSGQPPTSTGAEVAYTFGARVGTGTQVRPYARPAAADCDPRTMLLLRRPFLMKAGDEASDYSGYTSKGLLINDEVYEAKGCMALLAADRWTTNRNVSKFRVSPPPALPSSGASYKQPLVNVLPAVSGEGFPTFESNVNMVICDRVSEFFVEVWAKGQSGSHQWQRLKVTARSEESKRIDYLWCGNGRNPKYKTSGDVKHQPFMPSMIRVTLVVHPHNDTALLRHQPYAGNFPVNRSSTPRDEVYPKKYRGMVFRQVLRVPGLVRSM